MKTDDKNESVRKYNDVNRSISLYVSTEGPVPARGSDPVEMLESYISWTCYD